MIEQLLRNKISEWRKAYYGLTMGIPVMSQTMEEATNLLDEAWNLLTIFQRIYDLQLKNGKDMKNKKVLKHLTQDIKESKKSIKEDKELAKSIKAKKKK